VNKKHLGLSLEEAVKSWEEREWSLRAKIEACKSHDNAAQLLDRISFLSSVAHQQYRKICNLKKKVVHWKNLREIAEHCLER